MPQIFHPSTNTIAKGTIFGGLFVLAAITWGANEWLRSSYVTQVDVVRDQPVPFSHDHHTAGLGIDCRYCHYTVEASSFAGMPATEVCMGCHSQIWKESPLLAPVRESFRTGKPLAWTRVNDLPDFVYFNHSIHVAKGIGCESCHGRVDRMPLMRKAATLHMEWCLDCHRHPDVAVREPGDVFRFGEEASSPVGMPPRGVIEIGARSTPDSAGHGLVEKNHIATGQLTDCVICHR
jgi:hypothetical protein